MPYGINTGGGAYGGAAAGLQAGLSLGAGLFNQAAERQQHQQDMGLRQQEFGLQQRAADRLDREESTRLNQTAIGAYDQSIAQLSRLAAAASARNDGAQETAINAHLDELRQSRQARVDKMIAPEVVAGVTQARDDAAALRDGQSTPDQLGPKRFSHVVGLTGHPAISFVDGYDHNDDGDDEPHGPISQAVNDVHEHARNGNWNGAHESSFSLMAPYVSPHPPDHPDHAPGLSTPYANPSLARPDLNTGQVLQTDAAQAGTQPDMHPHIGQTFDTIGALGTTAAAVNSHPDVRQLVIDGHDQGATNDFYAAQNLMHRAGGLKGIKQLAEPDGSDFDYMEHRDALIAKGVAPDAAQKQAAAKIAGDAVEDTKASMRAWYLQHGQAIPEDLKEDEKDKAARALQKAGYSAQDALLAAYAPSAYAEKVRSQNEAPVHAADIRLKNAQADYVTNTKGRRMVPVVGSDGAAYSFEPTSGAYIDNEGNPAPAGVTFSRMSAKPAEKPFEVDDPDHIGRKVLVQVGPDGQLRRVQLPGAHAPQSAAAAGVISGPEAPTGEVHVDAKGRKAESLGGGQWRILQ